MESDCQSDSALESVPPSDSDLAPDLASDLVPAPDSASDLDLVSDSVMPSALDSYPFSFDLVESYFVQATTSARHQSPGSR